MAQMIKIKSELNWGWYVVAGSFLLMAINYGARYCFGVFIKPLSAEYGWSRSVISFAVSLMIITYGVGGIFTGRLLDIMAPRRMMIIGTIAVATGFILTTFITSPWQFYLIYGLLCGAGASCFGVVVCNSSVAKWFVEKRGFAIGIASIGIGFGTMVLAPLAGYIVNKYGWRMGFIFLGVMVLLIGISVSQLFMGKACPNNIDTRSEDTSTQHIELAERCADVPSTEKGSLRLVLANSRFWVLAFCFSLAVVVEMMAFMHQVAYAIDNQIDKIAAASSIGIVGIASILGRFFFGWLSDRIPDAKYAACLGFIFMIFGILVLLYARTPAVLFLYAWLFGFGYGSLAPLMPFLLADRFGSHVLGASYGMLTFFVAIGGGIGPLLGGLMYDRLGSYHYAWKFGIAALVVVTFMILLLRPRDERSAALQKV